MRPFLLIVVAALVNTLMAAAAQVSALILDAFRVRPREWRVAELAR